MSGKTVTHWQIKETSFYYAVERFSVVCLNVCKKSSFQLIKKEFPNLNSQTLETRIAEIRPCKENHRVRSKILELAFSMKFLFKTKLGCFITRSCALHIVICPDIFWTYIHTRFIVERFPHSHIQRYFCNKHDTHKRW